MPRFIIHGHWCEIMAVLHTSAKNKEEAMVKYNQTFSEDQRQGLDVDITEVTPELERFYEPGSFYSGMYKYDL